MQKINIGILGGDYRYKILKNLFKSEGLNVKIFGNIHIENNSTSLDEMLDNTDLLIGPIPYTKDKKYINLFCEDKISISELLLKMKSKKIGCFIAGVLDEEFKNKVKSSNIKVYDFFEIETVAVKNAVPTAEGAIMTAMEESEKTLFGSDNLILGYGRCGKILAHTLKGLGANVSVSYRKQLDLAYISAYNYNPIKFDDIEKVIGKYDFIFNTIPALVLNKKVLNCVSKNATIIDIAQAPGGVDYNYARSIGLRALYCPGLPGRIAPVTAAEILKEAVETIVAEIDMPYHKNR